MDKIDLKQLVAMALPRAAWLSSAHKSAAGPTATSEKEADVMGHHCQLTRCSRAVK